MTQYGRSGFSAIPDVVKNLLIINVIVYIGTTLLYPQFYNALAMHFVLSDKFQPYQIVTHMFMHSNFTFFHILLNMYALWLFGSRLEYVWGPKKFLIFYLVCGFGAIFVFMGVQYFEFQWVAKQLTGAQVQSILSGSSAVLPGNEYDLAERAYRIFHSPIVGASGAIFGVLVGFGMLFPNTKLMLIFPPIPIPAKVFVGIYIVIELFAGVQNNPGDNVAHFAHLGGALFGFILVTIWKKQRNTFY